MSYNGSFKRFEGEIIHLFGLKFTPRDIEAEFFRRSGGRPYLAGGAYMIPSFAMISYILREAGLLSRTCLSSTVLETRIRNCFKNEGVSPVDAELATDEELLSIPNFGVLCLARVRQDQALQFAEWEEREAPIG